MPEINACNMKSIFVLISSLLIIVNGQDRRPTISFITQPEIVTDIGATAEMECSVQVGINMMPTFKYLFANKSMISTNVMIIMFILLIVCSRLSGYLDEIR